MSVSVATDSSIGLLFRFFSRVKRRVWIIVQPQKLYRTLDLLFTLDRSGLLALVRWSAPSSPFHFLLSPSSSSFSFLKIQMICILHARDSVAKIWEIDHFPSLIWSNLARIWQGGNYNRINNLSKELLVNLLSQILWASLIPFNLEIVITYILNIGKVSANLII